METSLDKLKSILKTQIGLDTESIGEATLHKILNQRMRHCNIDRLDDYYVFLQQEKTELTSLLEAAVIPETWFFRDTRPFDIILQGVKKQLLSRPMQKINILSMPCSTGEEPYSIAMYLLSNGIPENSFNIHAVDISTQSLEIAQQACYGNNSFRGKTVDHYLNQYFKSIDGQYQLDEKIKNQVNFSKVNILKTSELTFNETFDYILCRNLLIYFDLNTKQQAFTNINKILKQDGLLFIGHSEFGSVPKELFYTTGSENAFALIKASTAIDNNFPLTRKHTLCKTVKNNEPATDDEIKKTNKKPFSKMGFKSEKKITAPVKHSDKLLVEAIKFADSGSFSEAEDLCHQHIKLHGNDCESFFLLGLIAEATGKYAIAEALFRKAVYLNPRHYETLAHLALVAEKNGDIKSAKLFKQRAERCKQS
ncbi:MAG: methyltransferase domain-containing protein [Gammaproteobacteria bacterium]|nr:methyltransferase domain-containing protein [Gammaproteobacteria bacterium]